MKKPNLEVAKAKEKPKYETNFIPVTKPVRLITVRVPGDTPSEEELKGAIVRIIAEPGETAARCADVAASMVGKAARVVVLPSVQHAVVTNDVHERSAESKSMRELLEELVGASGFPDKMELSAYVSRVASEAGL